MREGKKVTFALLLYHLCLTHIVLFLLSIGVFLTSTIELIHQGIYMHACDSGSRYYTIALVDCFTRSVCGCVYGMKSNHSARHYFLFFCFCSEKEKKIVVQNKRETRVSLPSLFQLMQWHSLLNNSLG